MNRDDREKNIKYDIQLIDEQKTAKEGILSHPFTFLIGNAGSGKTISACATALDQLFKKNISKIIITRPTVSTEDNGFLPGSIQEKMDPWLVPIRDNFRKIYNKKEKLDQLERDEIIEIVPLTYFRGRSQPLDCLIYTPIGKVKMGDLKVGDEVICPDSSVSIITNIFPQGIEDVYKITFSDHTYTKCSGDHLWKIFDKNHYNKKTWTNFKIKSLNEFKDSLFQTTKTSKIGKYRIPITNPISFNNNTETIDPYLLGLLIGDSCISQPSIIRFTTADEELIGYIQKCLPTGIIIKKIKGYDYSIVAEEGYKNILIHWLNELNLMGKKSNNKFIPENYKYNSIQSRLELLRGLMDSDGSIYTDGKKSRMTYSTVSEKLCNDVIEIVQSLGGICYKRIRKPGISKNVTGKQNSYELNIKLSNFNPFKLKRKADRFNPISVYRTITSVEYVGKEETQCISIDHPEHLYLTDNFIVTHNTYENAICIVDEFQNMTKSQLKMCIGRLGKNSHMIFCGDDQQIDLKVKQDSAIWEIERIKNSNFVFVHELKTNHRHEAVFELLELLK